MQSVQQWKAQRTNFNAMLAKVPADAAVAAKAFKASGLEKVLGALDKSVTAAAAAVASGNVKNLTAAESTISKLGLDLMKTSKAYLAAAGKDAKFTSSMAAGLDSRLKQCQGGVSDLKDQIAEERAALSNSGPELVGKMIPPAVFAMALKRSAPQAELDAFASKSLFGVSWADGKTKIGDLQAYQKKAKASATILTKAYSKLGALQKSTKTRKEAAEEFKTILNVIDKGLNEVQMTLSDWMTKQSEDLVAKNSPNPQQAVKMLSPLQKKVAADATTMIGVRDQVKKLFASVG